MKPMKKQTPISLAEPSREALSWIGVIVAVALILAGFAAVVG